MKPERIQPPKIYYRGTATVEIELDGEHHFLGNENRLLPIDLERGSRLANGETLVLLVDPRDETCFGNAAPDLVSLETCSPAGSADVFIVLSAAATTDALSQSESEAIA